MGCYYKKRGAEIAADMEIWDHIPPMGSDDLIAMDAAELIAYAEAVPTWDYVEPGMWDYLAWWYDLEVPEDPDDFDPEEFLSAAKAAESERGSRDEG